MFEKGHENYHNGKINIIDTLEWHNVVDDYIHGRISQTKAAKKIGISTPTFIKYLKIYMQREIANGNIVRIR